MNFWVVPLPPMTSSIIWMDSTPSKLSKESKITEFGVRMKKIRPREVKRGFSKAPHAAPLNVCEFSVYLVASNDSKIDIDRFYSLLAFRRDLNHFIWRSNERVMIV